MLKVRPLSGFATPLDRSGSDETIEFRSVAIPDNVACEPSAELTWLLTPLTESRRDVSLSMLGPFEGSSSGSADDSSFPTPSSAVTALVTSLRMFLTAVCTVLGAPNVTLMCAFVIPVVVAVSPLMPSVNVVPSKAIVPVLLLKSSVSADVPVIETEP